MDYQKSVLVAEDEKPYQRALALKLEHAGFLVETAGDGEEAIKILHKKKFDLILLDLVMPKINGFLVLEEIKNKNINIPVIILSNLAQEEDKAKVKKLGAVDFFEKANTSIVDIINKVEAILKNK